MSKKVECAFMTAQVSNRNGIEVVIDKSEIDHITREGEKFVNNRFELSFTQFKNLVAKEGLRVKLLAADISPKNYVNAAAFVASVVANGKGVVEVSEVAAGDIIPDTDGLTAENDMMVSRIVEFEPSKDGERAELLQMAKTMYLQAVATMSTTIIKPLF